MKYDDVLNSIKKSAASAGEIGWNAAGALGGGAVGYLLSRIMHRRRSGLRDLLYAFAGAGTGMAGINYAMDRKPDDGGKTWREKLQLAETMLPEIEKVKAAEEANKSKGHLLAYSAGGAGALFGGFKGYKGMGLDISGRRRANEIINSAMQDKGSPLTAISSKAIRQQAAKAALGTTGGRHHGLATDLKHPIRAWEHRVYDRVADGNMTISPEKNWTVKLNKPGQRLRNAGHVAADVAGNAALLAALGYGGGRLAESLGSSIGADKERIKDAARDVFNR